MAQGLNDLVGHITEIAEQASKIALSYFRQPILIEMKENHTPVTIADKKTEETIRKELEKHYPDFGILGEEFGEVSKKTDFVWTIDPIDGTRSFIRGIPLFGTLVGLLRKGQPVLGIMVLPALDETYWSVEKGGTYCNGTQIHVSACQSLEASILCHGDINCFEDSGRRKTFNKFLDKAELVRGYTDCFGYSLVLRGAADAMIDPIVSLWDIAPIACLVREAGGSYFNFEGKPSIQETSFVACAPGIKNSLLEIIKE